MQETGSKPDSRISVKVSLSGYTVNIIKDGVSSSSEWMGADRFFTAPEFRSRYDDVSVSLFTPKFSLVPESFFSVEAARSLLKEVADISDSDMVEYVRMPRLNAVMVYSNTIGETFSKVVSDTVLRSDGSRTKVYPEIFFMLESMEEIPEYNKVVASFADNVLYLAIAQGRSLQLCSSYQCPDFVTAEYYIFLAMKKLQLNPEMTTIYFGTPLQYEQEMSLYRYFKAVDRLLR